ncbi:MAG: hypothetical protein GF388_07470, partial [Candidatus Aegiribacteria sp.]|nr:hypothetical protein [Candidatus Aegiribacteria sp.]MBD3294966.1 hypothetical protein [Candidatus Fermentibacteria bacterium]
MITLVYPNYGEGRRSKYFPFGLAYVAASLRRAGFKVTVVDMEGEDLSVGQALERIVESDPSIVGIGGMVTRYRIVRELGTRLRRELPHVFLISGNSGASTLPQLYLEKCGLDAVILGEGEMTAAELASAVLSGEEWRSVPGIAFMGGNGVEFSSPRKLIGDLDSLPHPAWDLFPVQNYVISMDHRQKTQPHMEVVASRGCPYSCVYCYHIYGRKV